MKKNLLKNNGVQSLLASLACVVLGLLIGYIVLLFINPNGAGEAIAAVMKNFLNYSKSATQAKYLGNTLVKTAPLLLCALSILFSYKVGLFNIGAAGQYCAGVALSLYAALAWGWGWLPCMLLAMLGGMVLGAISGLLKSYCNVNEVISGIMLNWIVLYLTNMLLTNVKEETSMARNILVVEDDNNISNLIKMYLDKEGFDVRIAADGGKAVEEFKEKEPDLVLLDVMLPVLDGWGVCAKIRETSKCPIIMLTAKGEVNDRIHGLEMGADDYVVKPFEMKELLARINAVLRRSEIPEDTHKRLTFDKLIIDLDSYELIVDGKKIDTPPKELELLYHLAATPNRVYTRNQLLDEVWGFDYFGDSRTVDVHVKRLREKVENVSDQWALKTVWGVGYKFEVK